jgi:hypothetical protein
MPLKGGKAHFAMMGLSTFFIQMRMIGSMKKLKRLENPDHSHRLKKVL